MSAVARLSVAVEEIGDEHTEPMLVISCTDPRDYPVETGELNRIKRVVAGTLGISREQLVELSFHFKSKATQLPLLGLPIGQYSHLANRTDCELITKVRRALGLRVPENELAAGMPTDSGGSPKLRQPVIKRRQPFAFQ